MIEPRERTFDEVLEEFPYLTILGFSSSAHVSASERDAGYTFAFCWSWLLNARPRVERCAAWLKTDIKPTKTSGGATPTAAGHLRCTWAVTA